MNYQPFSRYTREHIVRRDDTKGTYEEVNPPPCRITTALQSRPRNNSWLSALWAWANGRQHDNVIYTQ